MVGLCNICDVIGARNWEDLNDIIEELKKEISAMPIGEVVIDCEKYADSDEITDKTRVVMVDLTDKDTEFPRGGQCNPLPKDSPILLMPVNNAVNLSYYACNKNNSMDEFLTRAKVLKGHLLSRFVDELDMQSACSFHNMSWLLAETTTCPTGEVCEVCVERFNLFDDINATIMTSKLDSTRKIHYLNKIRKVQENLRSYIGHLVRGKYQRMRFMHEIEELKPGKALVVCDYMMKLLLQKFREPQGDWYAKKGVSLHGRMFFYKRSESSDIEVDVHDVFSNGDCVQNWYFTASAFEATIKNFTSKHDDITSLVIWSDNGPHYHNTSIILWLMRFPELCPIKLERYSFFEAQKGKMSLDSHFATFKFVLRGWMNDGNDILSSEDIVNGTKDHLKGTHVYEIHIDRSREPKSANTWNGISMFGDFTFVYNNRQCIAIDVREQTSKCDGKAKRFERKKLFELLPNYLKSDTISTGVTSDSNDTDESGVQPRFLKKAKEKTQSTEVMVAHSEKVEKESACPKCGKQFLRIGCLKKHVNSNLCIKSRITSQTEKQLRESLPVNAALGFAKEVRNLEAPKNMHNDTNTIGQSLFNSMLQESARKECSK